MKYRVIKAFGAYEEGHVFVGLELSNPRVQEWIHRGRVERIDGLFETVKKDLRQRIVEYQLRILGGDVKPGEIVFLRGVSPPTIARIIGKAVDFANAHKVKLPGGSANFMVDFDPVDWSLYWVDSGLKIQRWDQLAEGYVYQIAEGNYPHRPGADEAAKKECERRRQARKKYDVKDVKVTVAGIEVTGVSEGAFSYGQCEHKPLCYGKSGLHIDELAKRQAADRLDRAAIRRKIAKRIGVSERHVSEDSVNYELAVKGAAQAAQRLSVSRHPENMKMQQHTRDADAMQHISDRFPGSYPQAYGQPKYDEVRTYEFDVCFGGTKTPVAVHEWPEGKWNWCSRNHRSTAPTLEQACDDFEAWVREQFALPEPSSPKEVVTRHIGTGDMGGKGTGGHR